MKQVTTIRAAAMQCSAGSGLIILEIMIMNRFSDEASRFEDDQGGLDGALHQQGHHEEEALLEARLKVHHHVQGKTADWVKHKLTSLKIC